MCNKRRKRTHDQARTTRDVERVLPGSGATDPAEPIEPLEPLEATPELAGVGAALAVVSIGALVLVGGLAVGVRRTRRPG